MGKTRQSWRALPHLPGHSASPRVWGRGQAPSDLGGVLQLVFLFPLQWLVLCFSLPGTTWQVLIYTMKK